MGDHRADALIVADVQEDFLPGGALGVPGGDEILKPLNEVLEIFGKRGLPVFATRDWHPPEHCSFRERGGPWPRHCVAGSPGARFSKDLRLPPDAVVISKATDPEREAYSAFDGTDLGARLRGLGVQRVVIGGMATDYCVRATARDALKLGLSVLVLRDGVRAVDPVEGERVLDELQREGATVASSSGLMASVEAA